MRTKQKASSAPLFGEVVTEEDPFSSVTRDRKDRGVLALDIATKTGWCTCTTSGVWSLTPKKDESKNMRLIRFKAKLNEICEAEKIKLIVFELPAIHGKHPNFVGMEMVGVMKLVCGERNIDHTGYPPTVIQKFATGVGKGNKPRMIETCREKYGIDPVDDNEADSVHLYHLAIKDLQL